MNDQDVPPDSTDPHPAPASTMRRDVVWAYVASVARISSSALVAALLYRFAGAAEFAMFAMIRGTIGILNYTSLGLAPAMVRLLAEAQSGHREPKRVLPEPLAAETLEETPEAMRTTEPLIYSNGVVIAGLSLVIGLLLTAVYAHFFRRLHVVPPNIFDIAAVVVWIGLGTLMRLFSDASGAVLQTRGLIALDNQLLASTEFAWILFVLLFGGKDIVQRNANLLVIAAFSYALAGGYLAIVRTWAVARLDVTPWPPRSSFVHGATVRRLAVFGSLVLLAQLADYLYAPTDYILINRFLGPTEIAAYAPAVQIDAGLLMLVTGLAGVLLPKAALAHTAGSMHTVRRYYIRGTLAGAAVLVLAALCVWAASPWLFRVWFGPNPPPTQMILPLVLIHTVIGGSSSIGRSILLAMGKVKPFTASVLIAGAVNVVASLCFVYYLHWGLRGIVLGTIVAVIGRCVLWMPWYVLWTLRRELER